MTTLLERCQEVTAKAQKLALAQRHANQQLQVQERTREWKNSNDKLKIAYARAAYLPLSTEAKQSVAEKRSHLRHNAATVLERLKSQNDIVQLTEDSSWARLLASVEGLTEKLDAASKLSWKSFIEDQGRMESPAWLRNRAPSTPTNDAAVKIYQANFNIYAGLIKLAMPIHAEDVSQLSTTVAACKVAVGQIEFDVPQDMERFFQAVQSGSATLATLTPDALKWLTENKQLERYQIRSVIQ